MALTMEHQHHAHHLGSMGYDHMRFPHFTNPWASTSAASAAAQMYPTSLGSGIDSAAAAAAAVQHPRPSGISMSYTNSVPVPGTALGSDMMSPARHYGSTYQVSPAPAAVGTPPSFSSPTSAPHYQVEYPANRSPYAYSHDRRESHQLGSQRDNFADTIDASRSIMAMSQDLNGPRSIYGSQAARPSMEPYGFPTAHSPHSSVSSQSTYPTYYTNSSAAESSSTDYTSDDALSSRTLPKPPALVGNSLPQTRESMMSSFNSRVSSSSQKKHKCKICDKRFTRPSSLQTHMYSHTGEKPFACEVEGCGRHFSVVSNLRRHRKVHKNDRERTSPEVL